jgi:hypothetical protein
MLAAFRKRCQSGATSDDEVVRDADASVAIGKTPNQSRRRATMGSSFDARRAG